MLRKSLAFVVVALLLAAGASAQSVGLVLSGGGAKGLYHIGVIQALEENEIPIDYVAGTSMGSIIAALYAAGYSPEEMRAIVDSGQVREWVSGRIDSRYASYYRQMQDQPSMLTLRLNLRDEEKRSDAKNKSRLVLPSHLISSSQIDLALAELLTPASTASGGDFDRLMVPFRCVASDLVARKPYVLKTGDLGEAVRASMAIPLAFNPIEKDSMLLYDGGIYDNFPWKPLDEDFRPDLIVGSICTEGNTPPSEESNIMDQAFMLAMHDTDYTLPEERSVTIRRAVGVNMLDFDQAEAIMNAGYEDAVAAMPQLLEKVAERRDSAYYAGRREAFRAKCPPLVFDDYKLEGLKRAQREYIRDFVQVDRRTPGIQRPMGFEELKDNLFEVLYKMPKYFLRIDDIAHSLGMPISSLLVLCVLREGKISIGEISERLCIAKPNVTPLVETLCARGLISRQRSDKDRRKVLVGLMPEGEAMVERIRGAIRDQMMSWPRDYNLSEMKRVNNALAATLEVADDVMRRRR